MQWKTPFQNLVQEVHSVSQKQEFDVDQWLKAVRAEDKEVTAVMKMNNCGVRFQHKRSRCKHNSSVSCSQGTVKANQSQPEQVEQDNMKPLSDADLTVINPHNKEKHQLRFIVIPKQVHMLTWA